MEKHKTHKEFYNDILRKLYVGFYKKGERFPTQVELRSEYKVGVNSIKNLFRLLKKDEFILTQGALGTTVLFDINNPAHLAKVPFFKPNYKLNDSNTFLGTGIMFSALISEGVKRAADDDRKKCVEEVEKKIICLQEGSKQILDIDDLFLMIVNSTKNRYFIEIAQNLISKYIFIDRQVALDKQKAQAIKKIELDFYPPFKVALMDKDYLKAKELIWNYYERVYRVEGVMMFAVLDEDNDFFVQQTLYNKFIHNFLSKIIARDYRIGMTLPKEKDLAKSNNVSLTTVRKANGILEKAGLISRKRVVGTTLLTDLKDAKAQQWHKNTIKEQQGAMNDAFYAIRVLTADICNIALKSRAPQIIEEISQNLQKQWNDFEKYNSPLFVADGLVTPLVLLMELGILQRYYFHIYNELNTFMTMHWMYSDSDFTGSDQVYKYMNIAVNSLLREDNEGFIENVSNAQKLNHELFMRTWNSRVKNWL